VSDPQLGSRVPDGFPPKPSGSLPFLAIPIQAEVNQWPNSTSSGKLEPKIEKYIYVSKSLAIMNFLKYILEETELRQNHNLLSTVSERERDPLAKARTTELLVLAEECTTIWNSVSTFGSWTGMLSLPQAAREMVGWLRRNLLAIEQILQTQDQDLSLLRFIASKSKIPEWLRQQRA
jgi:hypothetical protein